MLYQLILGNWPVTVQQPEVLEGSFPLVEVELTEGGLGTGTELILRSVIVISQPVHEKIQPEHNPNGMLLLEKAGIVICPDAHTPHEGGGVLQVIDQPMVIGQLNAELSIL